MGFLIFAYRKLSLKRKINDLNFKVMMLQDKEQSMLTKIGNTQQSMSNMQSIMTATGSAQMAQMTNSILAKYYDKDDKGNMKLKADTDANLLNQEMYKANYEHAAQESLFKGMFDAKNKSELTVLNQQSTQISQQKASIESQLKQLSGELEGVEKAEDQAAKQDAPKFGLG